MTDLVSRSDTFHSESFGISLVADTTPRIIHDFLKQVVALNKELRSQLAFANLKLSRLRGNTDNATTEPDEQHAAVQSTGSEDPVASQSHHHLSTLDSGSSCNVPVQPESDQLVLDDLGPILNSWHVSLHGPRSDIEPEARSNLLLNQLETLHRMLEGRRLDNLALQTALREVTDRHYNAEEEFRHQLEMLTDRLVAMEQQANADFREKEALRVRSSAAQHELDQLKILFDNQKRDLQSVQQAKDDLQSQLNEICTDRDGLRGKVRNTESESKQLKNKVDSLNDELLSLKADNQQLRDERKRHTETIVRFEKEHDEYVRRHHDASTKISSLSDHIAELEGLQKSKEEELRSTKKQLGEERSRIEQLQSDLTAASSTDQHALIMQLRRKARDIELKNEELLKSHAVQQGMLEDQTTKVVEVQLRGQLEDATVMLKYFDDLARTRGETIENMKRENTEACKLLRSQNDLLKRTAEAEHAEFKEQSAKRDQQITELKSSLEQITEEVNRLRIELIRQRHHPQTAQRGSVSGVVTAPVGAAAATATHPTTYAQPLRQDLTADTGSPSARVGSQQSAVQKPANIQLPSASTHAPSFPVDRLEICWCQYCGAQHPDTDSTFVHEKDCLKRPCED